jgi:hypothetical protein
MHALLAGRRNWFARLLDPAGNPSYPTVASHLDLYELNFSIDDFPTEQSFEESAVALFELDFMGQAPFPGRTGAWGEPDVSIAGKYPRGPQIKGPGVWWNDRIHLFMLYLSGIVGSIEPPVADPSWAGISTVQPRWVAERLRRIAIAGGVEFFPPANDFGGLGEPHSFGSLDGDILLYLEVRTFDSPARRKGESLEEFVSFAVPELNPGLIVKIGRFQIPRRSQPSGSPFTPARFDDFYESWRGRWLD